MIPVFPLGGLPLPLGSTESEAPTVTRGAAEVDPYGVDVYWDGNTYVAPSGDLLTVSGAKNLWQALWRRLVTAPGEYRVRPSYGVGIGSYLKKPFTSAIRAEMRARILENLRAEPRIAKVESCDIVAETMNGEQVIVVRVVAQALGRTIRFEPFQFRRAA